MDFAHYRRALKLTLSSLGVEDDASHHASLTHKFESDKDRHEAWACESLLFAIDELTGGKDSLNYGAENLVLAMRGLLQAREYRGRRGGFLGVCESDAISLVQQEIEKAMRLMTHPNGR